MYLEIIPDEATDEQLAARDAGIVADVATMFDDTEPAPDEESRERILDGAVEGILADENPDDFTQLGTIRVDVVRERTGLADATAVEIAEARARVRRLNPMASVAEFRAKFAEFSTAVIADADVEMYIEDSQYIYGRDDDTRLYLVAHLCALHKERSAIDGTASSRGRTDSAARRRRGIDAGVNVSRPRCARRLRSRSSPCQVRGVLDGCHRGRC